MKNMGHIIKITVECTKCGGEIEGRTRITGAVCFDCKMARNDLWNEKNKEKIKANRIAKHLQKIKEDSIIKV